MPFNINTQQAFTPFLQALLQSTAAEERARLMRNRNLMDALMSAGEAVGQRAEAGRQREFAATEAEKERTFRGEESSLERRANERDREIQRWLNAYEQGMRPLVDAEGNVLGVTNKKLADFALERLRAIGVDVTGMGASTTWAPKTPFPGAGGGAGRGSPGGGGTGPSALAQEVAGGAIVPGVSPRLSAKDADLQQLADIDAKLQQMKKAGPMVHPRDADRLMAERATVYKRLSERPRGEGSRASFGALASVDKDIATVNQRLAALRKSGMAAVGSRAYREAIDQLNRLKESRHVIETKLNPPADKSREMGVRQVRNYLEGPAAERITSGETMDVSEDPGERFLKLIYNDIVGNKIRNRDALLQKARHRAYNPNVYADVFGPRYASRLGPDVNQEEFDAANAVADKLPSWITDWNLMGSIIDYMLESTQGGK